MCWVPACSGELRHHFWKRRLSAHSWVASSLLPVYLFQQCTLQAQPRKQNTAQTHQALLQNLFQAWEFNRNTVAAELAFVVRKPFALLVTGAGLMQKRSKQCSLTCFFTRLLYTHTGVRRVVCFFFCCSFSLQLFNPVGCRSNLGRFEIPEDVVNVSSR